MPNTSLTQLLERSKLLSLAALCFLVFVTFLPAVKNDFLYWDDNIYVFQEPLVTDGEPSALLTFFHTNHHGNFYPVTLSTFWVEHRLFALTPAIYHLTNILLHILNTLLCCRLLQRLSCTFAVAWLATLLFAVHPLRVEAVVWISARKDLLATLFFLAALNIYTSPLKRPLLLCSVFVLHLLALMSKATAVTLPVVLILIDLFQQRRLSFKSVIEKTPLLLVSAVFGLLAIQYQHAIGATDSGLPATSVLHRLANASFAVFFYFGKIVAPFKLSAFYLYPLSPDFTMPRWIVMLPVVLVPLCGGLFLAVKKFPVVIFGLLFSLITIGPLLQVLPVGAAIAADRYTYLPSIGLSLVIAWLATKGGRVTQTILLAIGLLVLPALTAFRIPAWRSTESLMSDQLRNFPTSVFAWNDRGVALMARGEIEDAYRDYAVALSLRPNDPDALLNIGRARKLILNDSE